MSKNEIVWFGWNLEWSYSSCTGNLRQGQKFQTEEIVLKIVGIWKPYDFECSNHYAAQQYGNHMNKFVIKIEWILSSCVAKTFEPHIKYLKARCLKPLNILKVRSRTEWGAEQTNLLKLYRSLVRSKLDYGCLVYGSASKTALAKLDLVHDQGLRLSLGAFRSSPVESSYVEALQYIGKLKPNPGNPAYNVVFNPKYQILYADKESATDSFGIHCKKLLKKAKIDIGEIAINCTPDVSIWDFEPVIVDFTLSEFDKSSTSSTVFKSRFNEVK